MRNFRSPCPGRVLLAFVVLAACGADEVTASGATIDASSTTGAGPTASTGAEPTTSTTGGGASTTTGASSTGTPDGSTSTTTTTTDTTGPATTTGGDTTFGTTGEVECACVPDNDRILVLSDEAEIWAYTPGLDAFEFLADVNCPGVQNPYSMAVDRAGVAWIQYSDDGNVYTFDPKDPGPCSLTNVFAKPAGFDYFALSFAPDTPRDPCDRLYLLNYTGEGPFAEGPGIGALGVFDPMSDTVTKLGPTDYDGGELAGTGGGRLFAFAGVEPAKLVEYDKTTAQPLSILPLAGFRKTRASAMAFHGGDTYLFTEAVETTCFPCLEASCPLEFSMCQADPVCADALGCSIALGDIQDNCGGLMPPAMTDCATQECVAACYPGTPDIFSKVTRLDFDDSEGNGQVLTLVNPMAPIRIVGAAASTCAPYVPQ
jgi:hypothetical protein